jgi:hypothetical protein
MSKPHLRALEEALARRGWRVVAVRPGDGYHISATWEVRRSTSQPSILIDFEGMEPGGDYCLPLEESYACGVRGRGAVALHFGRINRSRAHWEKELAAFVQALEDESST